MPKRGTWKIIGDGSTPPLRSARIENTYRAGILAAMTGYLGGGSWATVAGVLASTIGLKETNIYYRTYLFKDTACTSFACDTLERTSWYAYNDKGELKYGGETEKVHLGY